MKSTYKLTLFSDTESAHEGSSNAIIYSPDPATNELLIDMGRGLYKLFFQLLLLIEADHKIAVSIMSSLQQNERMEDFSGVYLDVRGALLRCIDDAEMDSLDTSTSTEADNTTPTPSPIPQPTAQEFENTIIEMIDAQRWSMAVAHVRQYRKYSSTVTLSPTANFSLQTSSSVVSCPSALIVGGNNDCNWTVDDISVILNVYSQRLIKEKTGTLNTFHRILIEFDSTTPSLPFYFRRCFYIVSIWTGNGWRL